jgi:hypothetical protein
MPLYEWHCSTCGCTAEVIRSFDEYERGPEPDELPKGSECTDPGGHAFERKLSTKVKVTRAPGWGPGSKGNWIWLFALGGTLCLTLQNLLD